MQKTKTIVCFMALSIVFLLALLSTTCLTHATSSSDEELVSELFGLSGVNVNGSSITSFNESTSLMPNSPHYLTVIKAEINSDNTQFEVLLSLVDGKIWSYSLSGNFSNGVFSATEYLTRASDGLEAYQSITNASYCNEFSELLSAAMQTQQSSAENGDFTLTISNSTSSDYSTYMTVHYGRKVNGYTLSGDCFAITVSKDDLLSSIVDNMIYYVATTNVTVTEQEAISMATPYATDYAGQYGQAITATNATFDYARDVGCVRGDNFAIYPRWTVSFTFDKVNNESVSGYTVAIWADNGQVYYDEPQGSYLPSQNGTGTTASWLIVAFGVTLIVLFLAVATSVKRKTRNRRNQK